MIAALLLSAIPFDSGQCATSFYQNHPLYIHVAQYPVTVPVCPVGTKAARMTSTYTFSNYGLTIDNPFGDPIVAVDIVTQVVLQYTDPAGVQYPVLGGVGVNNHVVLNVNVPANGSAYVPLYSGIFGQFTDCFGETATACGQPNFAPVPMDPFLLPTPNFAPLHALWFAPMTEVYIGGVAVYNGSTIRRYDFGYAINHDFMRTSADVQATGTLTWHDANGVEL